MINPRLLLLLTVLLLATPPTLAEPRHALLIGNAAYRAPEPGYNKLGPLPNPGADAEAMAKALEPYGFRSKTLYDLKTERAFTKAVNAFAKGLPAGATALVYYSGHGIGADGKNYLLPTGSGYDSTADVMIHGISAEWLLQRLSITRAQRVLLVLDACREHLPLDASKGPGQESFGSVGLPEREPVGGTLIAYAASKGQTAWGDDADDLSLYTRHLIRALDADPRSSIGRALEQADNAVYQESRDPLNRNRFPRAQRPCHNSGLYPPWCLSRDGCRGPGERVVLAQAEPIDSPPVSTLPSTPPAHSLPADAGRLQERSSTAGGSALPELLEEALPGGVKLRLRLVPGGSFSMGSPAGKGADDEHPGHEVEVAPFYMAETELTQAQWRAVMEGNPSRNKGDDRPVETVSWDQAQEFLKTLGRGYRLPSEAEWEYAARAGSTSDYSWGDQKPVCKRGADNGAVFADCDGETKPVRFSAPNGFGLYDLHGNVWEWVQDCWHGDYKGAPRDGRAWEKGGNCERRVLRGGSWNSHPGALRAAYRDGNQPVNRNDNIGFRVVRSAP